MARKRRKPRASPSGASSRPVRGLDEKFHEWRFEPRTTRFQYLGAALMSVGGVALGAGVYALLLRDEALTPLPYAPYLLAAGLVLVVAYVLFGRRRLRPLRVGDLGVGFEHEERVTRAGWFELADIRLRDDALRFVGAGKVLELPLAGHAAAARRLVSEAKKRIPKRLELDDEELRRLGEPSSAEGERVVAQPPQVTQLSCLASGKPLTIEKDVRLCARCGAHYHRRRLPRRCLECGKKLKRSS